MTKYEVDGSDRMFTRRKEYRAFSEGSRLVQRNEYRWRVSFRHFSSIFPDIIGRGGFVDGSRGEIRFSSQLDSSLSFSSDWPTTKPGSNTCLIGMKTLRFFVSRFHVTTLKFNSVTREVRYSCMIFLKLQNWFIRNWLCLNINWEKLDIIC